MYSWFLLSDLTEALKLVHVEGVESLKPEIRTESVDPIKPKDKLSGKTKKNVDVASPVPDKDKDKENKPKNNEKKTKDKEVYCYINLRVSYYYLFDFFFICWLL